MGQKHDDVSGPLDHSLLNYDKLNIYNLREDFQPNTETLLRVLHIKVSEGEEIWWAKEEVRERGRGGCNGCSLEPPVRLKESRRISLQCALSVVLIISAWVISIY